jgi:methionyl-tRNA formyltransferase
MQRSSLVPLLVTSPPLATRAGELLHRHFPDGRILVWQQSSEPKGRRILRAELLSLSPPICISFYNDYIFGRDEIDALACLVNIHPALPSLRGRGYDTLPILEGHNEIGATLHFVNPEIDAGPIIAVIRQAMPQHINHPQLRLLTQEISLAMLKQLLSQCSDRGLSGLSMELKRQANESKLDWSGERLSSPQLAAMLRDCRQRDPHHPAIQGLAAFPQAQATA